VSFDLIKTAWAVNNVPLTEPKNFLERFKSVANILSFVINLIFYVGIALTVLFLIIGGIRYITSGGSKEGAEAARGMITNAIIGFIVVLGALAIRLIVGGLLGPAVPKNVVPGF